MKKKTSETEIAINNRFFFALTELKRRRVIKGINAFADKHGLNRGNLIEHKNNHREDWSLRPDVIAFLAQDFSISCEWLLLGKGDMFNIDSSSTK